MEVGDGINLYIQEDNERTFQMTMEDDWVFSFAVIYCPSGIQSARCRFHETVVMVLISSLKLIDIS